MPVKIINLYRHPVHGPPVQVGRELIYLEPGIERLDFSGSADLARRFAVVLNKLADAADQDLIAIGAEQVERKKRKVKKP